MVHTFVFSLDRIHNVYMHVVCTGNTDLIRQKSVQKELCIVNLSNTLFVVGSSRSSMGLRYLDTDVVYVLDRGRGTTRAMRDINDLVRRYAYVICSHAFL